jgi:hypothetical protein
MPKPSRPKLNLIMYDFGGEKKLAACCGKAKGCQHEPDKLPNFPCDLCMLLDDDQNTIGQVARRLQQGDA